MRLLRGRVKSEQIKHTEKIVCLRLALVLIGHDFPALALFLPAWDSSRDISDITIFPCRVLTDSQHDTRKCHSISSLLKYLKQIISFSRHECVPLVGVFTATTKIKRTIDHVRLLIVCSNRIEMCFFWYFTSTLMVLFWHTNCFPDTLK